MISMVAEQCCIFYIDDDESWRRGAVGSWQRLWLDGLAQGGSTVWHRGGVDGSSGERIPFNFSLWRWVCG
jgi:hypothetical protein